MPCPRSALDKARSFIPEVVLLDIGLPGLDGYQVARRLRRRRRTATALLVALTGYGQEEDQRLAREAGFDHHLTKPVDLLFSYELLARLPTAAGLAARLRAQPCIILPMPQVPDSIPVPEELARELPPDPEQRQEVLVLGLREWRVRKALDAYRRGEGSLANAAQKAGISLREMIPLAYAHGLEPKAQSPEAGNSGL